jgi:hypothetical protein
VFSAAVRRILVSKVCLVVSLRIRWGGQRKERLRRQTATWPWAGGGGRRGLQNKALPGGVEQSTYLFVVVVDRDSSRVVVCLMRGQQEKFSQVGRKGEVEPCFSLSAPQVLV